MKTIRKIISIDEEKCNGCGLCITACHEGALQLVDGKAKLISESYCDGLGDCLPECPTGAITIEEREAAPFDEAAVKENMARMAQAKAETNNPPPLACGCPGTNARTIRPKTPAAQEAATPASTAPVSQLRQWPCQLQLVPVNAPYLQDANLLIAADCAAYAYANIHQDFMRNKVTLIGCPKLDAADYSEKIAAILAANEIKSITVLRMEVPCCGGLVHAVKTALMKSGKLVPWQVITIGTDGTILEQ
ncbi:MAG TPA: 4Fe-4S binding protein [Hydrogenispora sp.]|jgi:ferredoxin|nr:4Fe-4S binding protein [Hydrogenispora sp.]